MAHRQVGYTEHDVSSRFFRSLIKGSVVVYSSTRIDNKKSGADQTYKI